MKRFAAGFLTVVLALTFICCVYCHGEKQRFSLELWITNLTGIEEIPSIKDFVDVWKLDYYFEYLSGETGGGRKTVYYEDYTGDDPVLQFFSAVKGFFMRLYRCCTLTVDIISAIFKNLDRILPWNAVVETGGS